MSQKLKLILLELTHNKKRFGAMCTLIAFGILLWARLIILQNLPKTGFADPGTTDPGTTDPGTAKHADTTPEKKTARLAELPIVYLDTENTLAHDFFVPLAIESVQTEESTSDPQLTPKSQTKETEILKAAELEADQNIKEAAAALRLESVMNGKKPLAVINGDVLGLGETIEGFILEAVADSSVTLRRGKFRVELKIN